jgi:hypothetical protein
MRLGDGAFCQESLTAKTFICNICGIAHATKAKTASSLRGHFVGMKILGMTGDDKRTRCYDGAEKTVFGE